MDGTLVFDGRCGMCTRAARRLARLDRTGRLRIEPFQAPGMADRLGVPGDRPPESAWWLDSSGAVSSGARAINAALSAALGTPVPLWLYRLPGMGAVQNAVYRWVAAHRYRFRGVTPLCETEPQRCG
ncbi:thiol-disulfide oxidoreductase DCC family protein [Mycobacterium sp. HUMS_1102779]|uniref:thiol-disulfide oxidoreductase DCC family protein n=1 Tax=Mycobacterium sp. HUMS_1102779 TaxID=3383487 RepID=UPI00389A11BA